MPGFSAPELIEPAVAPAAGAVVFVPDRVLFIVVLMIFLRRLEFAGLADLADDRFPKRLVLF